MRIPGCHSDDIFQDAGGDGKEGGRQLTGHKWSRNTSKTNSNQQSESESEDTKQSRNGQNVEKI